MEANFNFLSENILKKLYQGLFAKCNILCFFALFFFPFIGKTQSSCQTAIPCRLDSLTQFTISDTVFWLKFTAQSSRFEMFVNSLDTIEAYSINSIQLYSGNCNQLSLITQSINSIFSYSLLQNNEYFIKLTRSTSINSNYEIMSIMLLDSTMYNYPWIDSTDCPPSPIGCECINNNSFSNFTDVNYGAYTPVFPYNAIWAGKICGWHALRATPGIQWISYIRGYLTYKEAIWTKLKNAVAGNEYFFEINYNNSAGYGFIGNEKNYIYLSNNNLMSYSLNHNLLESHDYFPLPLVNDYEVASFNHHNVAQSTNYKYDYKVFTLPLNYTNSNLYIFADTTMLTHIERISIKPIIRDTVLLCLGSSNNIILNVGNAQNQRVYWDNEIYNNLPTRQVSTPGEYWAIVTHNDSCKVKRHLFIVSDSNIVISGNHNTCDSITNYIISNPMANQTYHWSITPSNTGTILQNNNTNITVSWNGNNMSDSIPSFLNVVNNCGDSIHFKIWKCCSKTPLVFSDSIITTNFPNGDVYLNGTIIINANIAQSNTNLYMGQEAKIIVNPPYTFSFSSRSIEAGCNYMWDGIYLSSSQSSMIIQNAGHINDAFNAIVSENGAPVVISNTIFNKNLKGLVVKNNNGANNISITNCKFFSATDDSGITPSNIKLPYNRRGMTGIEINNVANAQIGNTSLAYRNTFSNLDFGINIKLSNVNIYNNIFYNFSLVGTNTGYGVYIEGNSTNQYTVNVGGYNTANARYSNLFFNCNYGIYQVNPANLKVICDTFSIIQNTAVSIFANQNRNIDFTKNLVHTASKGLNIIDFANTRLIVDSNNLVNISNCGLYAANATQQECYGATFRKNKISGTFSNGIYIGNVLARSNIQIPPSGGYERSIPYLYGNTISLSSYNVSTNYYRGICVDNCNKTYLEDNNISTAPAYSITTETQALRLNGIYVSASPYTTFCMDTITKFGMGIRMSGLCSSSKLLVNKIESNFYGVRLDNATIGNQGNAALRWVYRNSWTYPFVTGRYRVQGTVATNTLWFYDYNNGNSSQYTLRNTPPEFYVIGGFTSTYISNPVPQSCSGYNGVIWIPVNGGIGTGMINGAESEETLNTENFTMDSEENLYYQAACNYRELPLNSDLENNYSANSIMQSTFIDQFYKIDKLISENRIEEAIEANLSISPVNLIEQNHQTSNAIYLQSWAKGRFELTGEEQAILMDIANQSHIKGGYGVFTAWIMLGQTFQNEIVKPKNVIRKIDALLPSIYPNPAQNQITITRASEIKYVIIYDLQGREILKQINTSGDEIILMNTSTLKKGIYFVSLFNIDFSDKKIEKLVID